jgi:hypothetical protein
VGVASAEITRRKRKMEGRAPLAVYDQVEFLMADEGELRNEKQDSRLEIFRRLRGIAKDVYAEFGGGEAYLRWVREGFDGETERRETLIDAAFEKK